MITLRSTLNLGLVSLAAVQTADYSQQTSCQPNILWISTEDMSPRLGCCIQDQCTLNPAITILA